MSINSNMKAMMLQVKKKIPSLSGATKYEWSNEALIYVSIFKKNNMINTQSVKYNESTHSGLTFYKGIKPGINRLLDKDIIYEIKEVNNNGRITNLLLKVVDTNV